MSGLGAGARLYRAAHGQPLEEERDELSTATAMGRGRLRHAASRGDTDARDALRAWETAEQAKLRVADGDA